MSTILDKRGNKEKCQKFTPVRIVNSMLDLAGYRHELRGKRLLENSFGSGNILKCIVERYIIDSLAHCVSKAEISEGLSADIWGAEIDREVYLSCLKTLNAVVQKYSLPPVEWNLFNRDSLKWDPGVKFDFVIGNPPYIAYVDIDEDSKLWIKEKYTSCSVGKFDYCYAFIEAGLKLLNDRGKMVLLVPNSIYKNVFGEKIREQLHDCIEEIWEYPDIKMFEDTLTSSSIFLYNKMCQNDYIVYHNKREERTLKIYRDALSEKWVFDDKRSNTENGLRFGDYYHASSAVATLFNKAYIISGSLANDTIEMSILRPAAAPKNLRHEKEEYIIFPYRYDENGLMHYSCQEFEEQFPKATKHLRLYKEQLQNRSKDKSISWFEYGRSQALAHLNQRKLLISTVITSSVEIYDLDELTIPYCGIYITPKGTSYTLQQALTLLKSKKFYEYVMALGVSVSGKSKRITCKDVCSFVFNEEDMNGAASLCN